MKPTLSYRTVGRLTDEGDVDDLCRWWRSEGRCLTVNAEQCMRA